MKPIAVPGTVSEVEITLGRPDQRVTLPVTVLDRLSKIMFKFGAYRFEVVFREGYLTVQTPSDLRLKDVPQYREQVRGNNGCRVRRIGTHVFWEV